MIQFIGFLFLAFSAVALIVYGATLVGHASTSGFFPSLSSGVSASAVGSGIGSGPYSSSNGLSAVDFSLFAKNGKGWSAITQGYGSTADSYLYIGRWHNGIDIAANYGAPIYSPVTNGVVLAVGDQDDFCSGKGFGKFIVVQDNISHLVLLFAHLGSIAVSPGDTVAKDFKIGTIGASGLETGPHLHFSIFESAGFTIAPAHGCGPYPEGHDVDPVPYLGTTYQ